MITATLSGPTSGYYLDQSAAFTVALSTAAPTGGIVVTPASSGGSDTFQALSGGSNVTTISIAAGSTTGTFYLMPVGTTGNRSVSITTAPVVTYAGSPITYNADTLVPSTATLAGPTSGMTLAQSTAFTVTLDQEALTGGVVITPTSTVSGDTFQATSGGGNVTTITIPSGSTTGTFYLTTSNTTGNRSIGVTTSPILTYSGSPVTYNATGIYYYDLFSGSAGTPLPSHTADSGATWPNDVKRLVSANLIELDGNGMVFSSGTSTTIEIPSAPQPATQNFEILYSFVRLTALTEHKSGVQILRQNPFTGSTDDFAFCYLEGYGSGPYTGVYFQHSDVPVSTVAAGPAVGVTWYIKVDVATSGANTNFAAYYSAISGGPWTFLRVRSQKAVTKKEMSVKISELAEAKHLR